MVKNHLKRIATPKTWRIKRKKHIWITRPRGPHKFENCVSINALLVDLLKFAKTAKEVKNIVFKKGILVDGRKIKDVNYGAGIMDIIEVPELKERFRIILDKKGQLRAIKVDEKTKLCKIIGKKPMKGKVQLNFFDGKNILIEKDDYKVGDTVEIEFPNKIKDHFKFEVGSSCYLIGGNHIGEVGKIKKIEKGAIAIETKEGEFNTLKEFVYVVGKDKPLVKFE